MTTDDLITQLREFDTNKKLFFVVPEDVEFGEGGQALEVNDIFEEDDGVFVVLG